jgi:flagellar basal body P-ring formation protein FlgA
LPLRFSGTAVEMMQAAKLVRPLTRGETVRPADIVMERCPKAELGSDFISEPEQLLGLSVRRAMRAGQMLRRTDLMKPELVQRNEIVSLIFEMPGIVLTSRGKALESGADGDVISVLNVQSKRTVQGTVRAFGTVAVTSMTSRIAANLVSPETAGHAPSYYSRTE